MVVLLPLFEGERIRVCSKCPHVGLQSPIRERSSFYVNGRYRSGQTKYAARCRWCSSRKAQDWQERNRAQQRQTRREWYERRKDDEEFREQLRSYNRAHWRRLIDERPAAYEEHKRKRRVKDQRGALSKERATRAREADRMYRRLRAERKGEEIEMAVVPKQLRSGVLLPSAPFQNWLQMLFIEETNYDRTGAKERVAFRIGVAPKRIDEYLALDRVVIDEAPVDRAVRAEGRRTLRDVYPDGPDTLEEREPFACAVRLPLRRTSCGTPGCEARPERGRFCAEHSEQLARFRVELEEEGRLHSANGGSSRQEARRRRGIRQPTCCAPNCWATREPGQRFCWECVEAGFTEEDFG